MSTASAAAADFAPQETVLEARIGQDSADEVWSQGEWKEEEGGIKLSNPDCNVPLHSGNTVRLWLVTHKTGTQTQQTPAHPGFENQA